MATESNLPITRLSDLWDDGPIRIPFASEREEFECKPYEQAAATKVLEAEDKGVEPGSNENSSASVSQMALNTMDQNLPTGRNKTKLPESKEDVWSELMRFQRDN